MCKIITSTVTLSYESTMHNAVTALAAVVESNDKLTVYGEKKCAAQKALAQVNRSRQSDVFKSIMDEHKRKEEAAHPMVVLCKMGTYAAAGYKIPDDNSASKVPTFYDDFALLSLSAYVAESGADELGVKSAEWRKLIRDAMHLSIIKLAQGIKADVPALMDRMDISGAVRDAVKNGKKNKDGEMSYDVVQSALQDALDAIHMDTTGRDDGKNRYRINRQSCRWLEASFDTNKVTGNIIVPREEGMIDRMFQIMRHVIAGKAFDFETKEDKKNK